MSPRAAVAPATGKPCIRLSWSGLKRWEHCPQQHLRVMRREVKPRTNGRVFLEGNVVDRAQRAWLENGAVPGQLVASIPEWLERFSDPTSEDTEYVIRWKGDPRQDRADALAKCLLAAERLEPILLEHVVPHAFEPEKKFSVWVGIPDPWGERVGIQLTGGIDIVVRDALGNFALYDLKTTSNADYLRQTLGQAVFYDIAWGHWWGEHEQPRTFGFIAPLLTEKLIPVAVNDDHRRAMMQRIIKAAHAMIRDEWAPKESDSGCSWCEAQPWCPKYALLTAKDDVGRNRVSFAATAAARQAARTPVLDDPAD